MKVVWKVVRWVLGIIILTLDTLIRPKSIKRSSVEQQKLNKITSSYSIYQFKACPFCVKVRRQVRKFGLEIEFRDAIIDSSAFTNLTGWKPRYSFTEGLDIAYKNYFDK